MVAQARLLAIMYLSIILPLQWFSGNTHLLLSYGWGVRLMGCALDILREKVMLIEDYPQLILDENFMVNMFSMFFYLTPFKKYLEFMFTIEESLLLHVDLVQRSCTNSSTLKMRRT
jgi:hypothetical protein